MTKEEFLKVFESEETKWDGDNAFQGLLIISKYINPKEKDILGSVGHDIIYSVDIDELIDAGITLQDATNLRLLNWMIESEYDCMSCFI